MDSKLIVVLVVVPFVLILIGIILLICYKKGLFRKSPAPKESGNNLDTLINSKNKIAFNAQMIEELKVLSENMDSIVSPLQELQETLRYLSPSTLDSVMQIDEAIKLELERFRDDCNHSDDAEAFADLAKKHIKQVRVLIARRSTFTDK